MTQKYVIERNGLYYSGNLFALFGSRWDEQINYACIYSKEEAYRVIKIDIGLPNCNLIHAPTPV